MIQDETKTKSQLIRELRELRQQLAGSTVSPSRSAPSNGEPGLDFFDPVEIYRSIFEQAPISILVLDKTGKIIDINPHHVAHIGKGRTSDQDYLGKSAVTHPAIVKAGLSEIYARLLEGESFDLKEVYFPITTGGKSTYFNVKGVPLFQGVQVVGAITITEDITEQKRVTKALGESEKRYRMLAENVRDVIWTTDLNLRFTFLSPSVTNLLGYGVEETMAKSMRKILVPSSFRIAMGTFAEELEIERSGRGDPHRSRSLELEYKCKDGGTIWAEVKVAYLRHDTGEAFGILGVTRDISNRKQFEEALRESEQKYKSVVDNIGIGVALISPTMEVVTLNNQMRKWFPDITLSAGPICYRCFNNPPREGVCSYCPTIKTLKDGNVHEAITDTPAGRKVVNYRIISSPIKDKKGEVVAAIEMVEDITERKRAEEALKRAHDELEVRVTERTEELATTVEHLKKEIEDRKRAEEALRKSEERFRTVANFCHDWEYWISNDGEFIYNSPSCERITGYGDQDFSKDPRFLWRIAHPDDRELVEKHLKSAQNSKKNFRLDFRIITRTGEERWIGHACLPVLGPDGRMTGRRASNRDITDRKLAEEALRESFEKLKVFAYSVTHDLKSPATGLSGLAKLLSKQYAEVLEGKGKIYCEQILKASAQIFSLVDQINVYIATKQAPLNIEPVQLKEMVQNLREEFSSQLSKRQINWLEPASLPEIRIDKISMLRVLRNLVDNALKYGGEKLSEIRIGYGESDESHILSVKDDGVGVKQEASKKIFGLFNRYETAKGTEGTGLGLAIVKEIAEQHRGKVWAEPGARRGITFYFSIPKAL